MQKTTQWYDYVKIAWVTDSSFDDLSEEMCLLMFPYQQLYTMLVFCVDIITVLEKHDSNNLANCGSLYIDVRVSCSEARHEGNMRKVEIQFYPILT